MLLYYITDSSQFPGDQDSRRSRLLATVVAAAGYGVDYIQLREKKLSTREQEIQAHAAVQLLRTANQKLKTALLVNSRTDIALATGTGGVHLRSHDISPSEARKIWTRCGAGATTSMTVGVSCHSRAAVALAAQGGADFAVFGPVFEKRPSHPAGLEALHEACQEKIPVLALGGVTVENAQACMQAGAAGIAAIRLFQENDMGSVVAALRKTGIGPRASDFGRSKP